MKAYNLIETRLWQLRRQDYQMRFPGGTTRDGHSAAFAICYQEGPYGPELLMVPYKYQVIKESEYDDEIFPEDPRGALEREFLEETGAKAEIYEQIAVNEIADRANLEKKHVQYAYIITHYDTSNLRESAQPNKKLGPPIWIPTFFFEDVKYLKHHFLYSNHRWIFNAFNEWYDKRRENPEIQEKLFNSGVYA